AHVAEDALQLLMHMAFDLAIIDIFMRGQGGLVAIQSIRRSQPHCMIIATSGGWHSITAAETLRAAYKVGAHATLPKPFRINELSELAETLLGHVSSRDTASEVLVD